MTPARSAPAEHRAGQVAQLAVVDAGDRDPAGVCGLGIRSTARPDIKTVG
jgi:hypothetical protein